MNDDQVLSVQDVGEILNAAAGSCPQQERRHSQRFLYAAVQFMAAYDGTHLPQWSDFRRVYCRDLSTAGISCLLPERPDFEHVIFALGKPPNLLHVTAEVMNCRAAARGFVVGCHFLAKIPSPF
jgi:hypothetical protein